MLECHNKNSRHGPPHTLMATAAATDRRLEVSKPTVKSFEKNLAPQRLDPGLSPQGAHTNRYVRDYVGIGFPIKIVTSPFQFGGLGERYSNMLADHLHLS